MLLNISDARRSRSARPRRRSENAPCLKRGLKPPRNGGVSLRRPPAGEVRQQNRPQWQCSETFEDTRDIPVAHTRRASCRLSGGAVVAKGNRTAVTLGKIVRRAGFSLAV